jgi:arylsulfatase A
VLSGDAAAKPPHDTFYYFRGLKLEAVRHGDWKLQIAVNGPQNQSKAVEPRLYNLKTDLPESSDVAAANPDVVKRLLALVDAMKTDLGTEGMGPGCRPLGKVEKAQPIIGHDGKIREGMEAK